MIFPAVTWADVGLVLLYVVVLWLPGLTALLAAGSRGWTAAAVARSRPTASPGSRARQPPGSAFLGAPQPGRRPLVAALLGVGVRIADPAVGRAGTPRTAGLVRGHPLGVAAVVALGRRHRRAARSWAGSGGSPTIPQDWDAAFHANGIAWIANTGDGGLTGHEPRQLVRDAPAAVLPELVPPARRRGRPT